jgi:hypothetical protein
MNGPLTSFIKTWAPLLTLLAGGIGAVAAYNAIISEAKKSADAAVVASADLRYNDTRLFEITQKNDGRISLLERQAILQENRLIEIQTDLKYLIKASDVETRRYKQ